MKKFKLKVMELMLLISFLAMAILPQYLPIDPENQNRLSNIILLLGGPIMLELIEKIYARKSLWSSLKSTRDKIVVTASLFILVLAGVVYQFPFGDSKDSTVPAILSGIFCYLILIIGGSDDLKTMFTGHEFNENNKDEA